jgi:hypothetical protein
MELDRALRLAVTSCWDDLVRPDEASSVHLEYKNVSGLPLSLVEVWIINEDGGRALAFRYAAPRSNSSRRRREEPRMQFANSYRSLHLAGNVGFIMRNQDTFTRPADGSIHGFIEIETPSAESRKVAGAWQHTIQNESGAERLEA